MRGSIYQMRIYSFTKARKKDLKARKLIAFTGILRYMYTYAMIVSRYQDQIYNTLVVAIADL